MDRIKETFKKLKRENKKAFIVYLTCGYPDLKTTESLVIELAGRGVSMVELGVPFSDPLADGPTIQEASFKALLRHVTVDQIFSLVRRLRHSTEIPLIIMTYYNPVYQYGLEQFAKKASEVGIDGVIVPDLPPEEAGIFKIILRNHKLSIIFLLASNSPMRRMRMIARESEGFIYCLSHIGITGARRKLERNLKPFLRKVRSITDKPFVAGFGISRHQHVEAASRWSDGVVVGSAVIDVIRHNLGKKDLVTRVGEKVKKLL